MTEIRCATSTTLCGKYGVVKAWLKLNSIEYNESGNSAGSHSWSTLTYTLTWKQLDDLLSYLGDAGVLQDYMSDIII